MKRLGFLAFVALSVNFCAAGATQWYKGVVVLQSKQTFKGQIAIHAMHDVVLLKSDDDNLTVFHSHNVASVYYYDVEKNVNRKFISVAQKTGSAKKHLLYEVIIGGDVSVYCRAKFEDSRNEAIAFNYFARLHENEIVSLQYFKSRIFPELVRLSGNRMLEYISNNKLDPDKPADVIRIIEFFNRQEYGVKNASQKRSAATPGRNL